MLSFLATASTLLSCQGAEPYPRKEKLPEICIDWEEPIKLVQGGYGRIHRLNDGRFMAAWSTGGDACFKFSPDGTTAWTPAKKAILRNEYQSASPVVMANSEFAQLSHSNPYHPDRIIYAVNVRPVDNKSTLTPYSIAISVSDDYGKSWSPARDVYKSELWSKDVMRGCYEPAVLELPDGTVQIYFADETPYYRNGLRYQNISVIESKDGGESWSSERIVCYTEKHRDGMPVPMLYNGWIYVAIEASGDNIRFRPQIVRSSVTDSWKNPVLESSIYRFDPFLTSMESAYIYSGAPYLIRTDNYFAICYQSSEGGIDTGTKNATMEMALCRIDEMKKGEFLTMRGKIRPFEIDQTQDNAIWNSLCDLGDDHILAITQHKGHIWIRKGRIYTK